MKPDDLVRIAFGKDGKLKIKLHRSFYMLLQSAAEPKEDGEYLVFELKDTQRGFFAFGPCPDDPCDPKDCEDEEEPAGDDPPPLAEDEPDDG